MQRPDLSRDAPTVEHPSGGKQSDTGCRLDLVDAEAMLQLGAVLDAGEKKYGKDNWRLLQTEQHLNAALVHIYAHLSGNREDDHLGHALCRTMMALAVYNKGLQPLDKKG